MGKNSAEYMRAYRARRKAAGTALYAELNKRTTPEDDLAEARRYASEYAALSNDQRRRIAELEEEVRHLKAELAGRSQGVVVSPAQAARLDRKAQQAQRDAILRKINRGER